MGDWESIRKEAQQLSTPDAYDIVRRQKIDAVQRLTGRHLIIYAADFTTQNPIKAQLTSNLTAISLTDKDGFDAVMRNLPPQSNVDIMLHSPGGSAEATESIVEMLRSHFSHIRFLIPNTAKSAATMMAMAGEQLVMDTVSELGPTDPQLIFVRDGQTIVSPAQAIKDEFERAQREVNADPSKLPSWVPVLRQYGPSLLAECDNLSNLSRVLVSQWLATYMFAGRPNAHQLADNVANYLSNHNNFHSHARRVGLNKVQELGLSVLDLRGEPGLRDAIRDLYIALMLTFMNTAAYKIFENDRHEALVVALTITAQQQNMNTPVTVPTQPLRPKGLPAPQQPLNRAQRRQMGNGRRG